MNAAAFSSATSAADSAMARGQRIAVLGAGPMGLAVAYQLARATATGPWCSRPTTAWAA